MGARTARGPAALRTALLTALAALALLLVSAAPAAAHSGLASTSPADGTQLGASPSEVVLVFDEAVSTRLSQVQVTGPDGSIWSTGAPQVSGGTVTQPLAALGPAGDYSVAYRVVSADGHPVSGTSTFTLTAAGTGTAPEPAAAPAERSTSGGVPVLPLAGAGLLAVGGLALALRRRRPAPVA